MQIADHVFLVTGAASGLGRGVAEHLAAEGAKLVLADLDPRGEEVAQALGATFVRTDVADEAQGRAAVEAAVARMAACTGSSIARASSRAGGSSAATGRTTSTPSPAPCGST